MQALQPLWQITLGAAIAPLHDGTAAFFSGTCRSPKRALWATPGIALVVGRLPRPRARLLTPLPREPTRLLAQSSPRFATTPNLHPSPPWGGCEAPPRESTPGIYAARAAPPGPIARVGIRTPEPRGKAQRSGSRSPPLPERSSRRARWVPWPRGAGPLGLGEARPAARYSGWMCLAAAGTVKASLCIMTRPSCTRGIEVGSISRQGLLVHFWGVVATCPVRTGQARGCGVYAKLDRRRIVRPHASDFV